MIDQAGGRGIETAPSLSQKAEEPQTPSIALQKVGQRQGEKESTISGQPGS